MSLSAQQRAENRPELALMGTIPIYWGEAGGVSDLLAGNAEEHWARAELERSYRLKPVDYLSQANLQPYDFLLLAQPRALSAQENVALDEWVRKGGRLLLFADPMLTGESHFALGDRRRPQEVILLSPILERWGLGLQFAVDQPSGGRLLPALGTEIPVNLAGRFALGETAADAPADCALLDGDAALARCAIGAGTALVLADAAVLDLHDANPASVEALARLIVAAFGENGDFAGKPNPDSREITGKDEETVTQPPDSDERRPVEE